MCRDFHPSGSSKCWRTVLWLNACLTMLGAVSLAGLPDRFDVVCSLSLCESAGCFSARSLHLFLLFFLRTWIFLLLRRLSFRFGAQIYGYFVAFTFS